jgi:thiaminase (transcriptional activator TenA)
MNFSQMVKPILETELQRIYQQPFIQELASGNLDRDKFIFYLQQDWMYLNDFAQALAGAALLSSSPKDAAQLIKFSHEANVCEQMLHHSFFKLYQVPKQNVLSPACFHYTNFLRATVARGDYAKSLAALLPCFWVYREVGQYIFTLSASSNPYYEWIKTYASEEFSDSVGKMIAICDSAMLVKKQSEIEELVNIFNLSTCFEWSFWGDAYHMRHM